MSYKTLYVRLLFLALLIFGGSMLLLYPDGRRLYRSLDRFRRRMRLIDFQKNDILTRTGMKRTRFMPVFSSLNINQCLYLSLKIAFEPFTLKVILQS